MSSTRTTPWLVRAGLMLFALLSLADLVDLAATDGKHPPYSIAVIGAVLGLASLACLPSAWRGSSLATRILATMRIISALTAVPALFASGVPGAAVGAAAAIIVLTVMALLLVVGGRRGVPASEPVTSR